MLFCLGIALNYGRFSQLSHPISDSIWLAYGTLLIGSGHQMCLYGLPRQLEREDSEEGLFEYVARLNGPLADYHPQMLLQCLLWGEFYCSLLFSRPSLVKRR